MSTELRTAPTDVVSPDPAVVRAALWDAVFAGDEYTATSLVQRALDEGHDPESVLLDVIAPVQAEVGEEWAANRMSIAQEHAATAINDRAVAALSMHPAARNAPERGRITVACVDGEWHALPARLLAEVLRLRGWRVDYLGAQVPVAHLVAHLHRTGPELVALSSSIATRLPTAHATITACQAAGVPVVAGGAAFGPGGRYARLLGADAWAADARRAADRIQNAPIARPEPGHQQIDDLPHLEDQEYTMVTRARAALVRAVMLGLDEAFPALRTYSDVQRERTAEDLAHIVEFLATALYLDDADLFTDFIAWTASILTARGVPAHSLPPALDLLAGELKDFPRAQRLLRLGAERLAAPRAVPFAPARNHP
ncbi:B12-binding domain-containing protein [Streptomyces sp. NBC_00083]|uniref:cobalamin B12-binding domain-containing protein n=1 Tax=Streptomyces sp. NBC_00083 TaxID=2975647 RepID=UPI00225B9959|nr:B12-binding domain-containing protein [Streptomyces sp. NBC_00083]MCX5384475.1 cobalamin-dependent protein [Streptomyces sp. NBC_00083]